MEFFDVNGVRLAATVSGTPGATPLILLHAGGQDRSSWDTIAAAFVGTHRVYAVDLRGFGDSDRPGEYSFELMRDDILSLIGHLGADTVHLIGHSMGGTVAWLVAQAQPRRVAKLVIEDTPPPVAGGTRMQIPARPDSRPPFDWDALVAILHQVNEPDPAWWDGIGKVSAATLLLAGGAQSQVPQHLLREVEALLPAGRLAEIPAGHHIHRDAADEFLGHVVPFLTGLHDDLRRAYDGGAATRDQYPKEDWKRSERDVFAERLRKAGVRRLLELGAGTGQDAVFFHGHGMDVTAVDLSPEMVRRCREKGIDARVMDFGRLEFADGVFEAAYALNSLLHVPNAVLPSVLAGIARVLRPGGLFFLGVYGGEGVEGVSGKDWHDPPRFFSWRTDEQLRAACERLFDIEDFHVIGVEDLRFQSLTLRRR